MKAAKWTALVVCGGLMLQLGSCAMSFVELFLQNALGQIAAQALNTVVGGTPA